MHMSLYALDSYIEEFCNYIFLLICYNSENPSGWVSHLPEKKNFQNVKCTNLCGIT